MNHLFPIWMFFVGNLHPYWQVSFYFPHVLNAPLAGMIADKSSGTLPYGQWWNGFCEKSVQKCSGPLVPEKSKKDACTLCNTLHLHGHPLREAVSHLEWTRSRTFSVMFWHVCQAANHCLLQHFRCSKPNVTRSKQTSGMILWIHQTRDQSTIVTHCW